MKSDIQINRQTKRGGNSQRDRDGESEGGRDGAYELADCAGGIRQL